MDFRTGPRQPEDHHEGEDHIGEVAETMAEELPQCAETSAGLRKLLEAKDSFVRAALTKEYIMEMCSDGHDEIVHDERNCPLCEALEELNDHHQTIEMRDNRIEELESKIEDLEKE